MLSQEEPLRDFESCEKLGGEDHTRAVPGLVPGYLDAGEGYFGFWTIHTWVKDGRDVLHF